MARASSAPAPAPDRSLRRRRTASYLFTHPEPVTEEEAERLAADANRRHVTSVTPYAQPVGGGLVIAGRFWRS